MITRRILKAGVRYQARVYHEGRWHNAGLHESKQDAKRAERDMALRLESNGVVLTERTTVIEYLRRWFEAKQKELRPKPRQQYRMLIERHIAPSAIADIPLSKLRELNVREFFAGLQVGTRTQQQLKTCILKPALRLAVEDGLLVRNPCERITIEHSSPKVQVYSLEQVISLMTALEAAERADADAALFSIHTGQRLSEVVGMHWEDVGEGTLTVCRQLQETEDGLVELPTTKSDRARTLTLGAGAWQILVRQRARREAIKERLGSAWRETPYVFITAVGTPYRPRNVSRTFAKVRDAAGLPHIPYRLGTFHGNRHGNASQLYRATRDWKVVQERLGHSDPGFTAKTYIHLTEDADQAAAQALDSRLRGLEDN